MRSLSFLLILAAFPAAASDFDGSSASLLWGLPFALILLSIALGPLFFSRIWHHHFGKITAFLDAAVFNAVYRNLWFRSRRAYRCPCIG